MKSKKPDIEKSGFFNEFEKTISIFQMFLMFL